MHPLQLCAFDYLLGLQILYAKSSQALRVDKDC